MVVDLKEEGILQDLGELKGKEEKKSSSSGLSPRMQELASRVREVRKNEAREKLVEEGVLRPRYKFVEDKKTKQFIRKDDGYYVNSKKLKRAYIKENIKGKLVKVFLGIGKQIDNQASQRVISRKVLKSQRLSVDMSERQPAPYISRYFSDEVKEENGNLFFD